MDYVFVIKDMEEQIVVKLHAPTIALIMELAIKLSTNVNVTQDLSEKIVHTKNALKIAMDTEYVNLESAIALQILLDKVVII